ncbi:protein-disulfide reductase DsbD family protein [Catalinimonas niigatensis]|uniref:protein-disulfide reductase DsbD family protein n=1 Tax=Catalinimonas niigatensis TaxID=1397264 RepID=UPI002665AC08|nr:cytochrome c biogenesis protein CcdA [Catalinimonas niigatensis]WPP53506.1 protein-disulfide reductase DsbD family protein [Catalinimonas niigatensis]
MRLFKYFIFSSLILLYTGCMHAQVLKPATWSVKVSQQQVKVGEEVDVVFHVEIQEDWYLYSNDFDPDLGPMVTEINLEPNAAYELVGGVKPIGAKEKYDEIFEGDYTYFTKKAEFRQTIKVTQADLKQIKGDYEYQVCSDVTGQCIPFDDTFSVNIGVEAKTEASAIESSPAETREVQTSEKTDEEQNDSSITEGQKNADGGSVGETKAEGQSKISEEAEKEIAQPVPGTSMNVREANTPYTLLTFFFVAFLAGLAALLTPCVFPMIPMTVSFFTSGGSHKGQAISKAIIYGLSIIIIYTLIGTLVSVIFGPAFANWLSTHWLPNLFFFAVFVIFALSFFGLFEITLPSSLVNNVDRQADKGGYYGIFFMAFTLVLVSFSCTGPIVGSILVESAGGEFVKPVLGMLGFSLAFAIPFGLFAAFPQWLSSLPKSGGWLNSVKVVLGFLELALALKFLSVADQVYHWNILDREIYLALWIVIFTLMGFYLLGKLRLPHDSPLESISVPRLMLSIATFAFVVYLVPGMLGAPLKSLAGYLPPMHTHDFNMPYLTGQQLGTSSGVVLAENTNEQCEPPKYADMLHFPHGIKGYFDYEQALACAEAQNKPIFIDFTGHGCVNCREMEARVWSDPEVLRRLKEDYVVVALYVDEKTELPESEWYTSEYDGKVKKSIGRQNADFQITRFNNNAQPYYVLLDDQGQLLKEPKAYDLSVQNFIEFLDDGKERFAQGKTIADPALAKN